MVKLQHVHLPQFSQHFQYTMMPRSVLCIDPIGQRLRSPLSLRFLPNHRPVRAAPLAVSGVGPGRGTSSPGGVTPSSEPAEGTLLTPEDAPASSQVALTIGSLLEMADSPLFFRAKSPVQTKIGKTVRP